MPCALRAQTPDKPPGFTTRCTQYPCQGTLCTCGFRLKVLHAWGLGRKLHCAAGAENLKRAGAGAYQDTPGQPEMTGLSRPAGVVWKAILASYGLCLTPGGSMLTTASQSGDRHTGCLGELVSQLPGRLRFDPASDLRPERERPLSPSLPLMSRAFKGPCVREDGSGCASICCLIRASTKKCGGANCPGFHLCPREGSLRGLPLVDLPSPGQLGVGCRHGQVDGEPATLCL